LVFTGLVTGRSATDPIWVGASWLATETPIEGFLYKIGTFSTWLRRDAPLAGRQPVARLEDLYDRRVGIVGWAAWSSGVGLAVGLTRLETLITSPSPYARHPQMDEGRRLQRSDCSSPEGLACYLSIGTPPARLPSGVCA
jgi:hypothetical protein